MHIKNGLGALVILLSVFFLSQCQQSASSKPTTAVLLGNSLTYYNSGLGEMLEHLAASARPPIRLSAVELTMGSVPINVIWDIKNSIDAIPKGLCDVVVVQDTLGFSAVEKDIGEMFTKYARMINAWAKIHGARTVIYFEQVHLPLVGSELSLAEREQIHEHLSRELAMDIAPIGIAWQNVREQKPGLSLYGPDNIHPSIAGSYLAGCVLYATIFKKSPVGLPYHAEGLAGVSDPLSISDATYLQKVAWETSLRYKYAHVKRAKLVQRLFRIEG